LEEFVRIIIDSFELKRGITEFAISILLFINRAIRVGWKIREAINKYTIKI
jgi:hypothetical protein